MEAFENPAKTIFGDKSLDQDAKPLKEGSKGASALTVEKPWKNGVRVSINGKEGSGLDENGEGLEDSEMNGVSSLLQMKGSVRNIDVNGGSESVKGFGSLLGAVDKSMEIGVENVLASGDDGASLEDIRDETAEVDGEERTDLDDKENGGGMMMRRVHEIDDAEGNDDDGDDDWGCEFSAGDFVWGKIRSHPWWPGQVYELSNASDYAVKVRQKGRLLVAYFGDSSFAWCHPSQLKPFEENFEDMSKLSNSKNFVNAVQTSVDEIGRLVELKMTCSCVPKENCSGLDRPLAANAGIRKGVLVPEGGIGKLSIGLFEPEEILGKLKQIAQAVCMSNLLECTVLKGWVSAFNRSIVRYQMPLYHEPLSIPGLEVNVRTLVVDISEYSEAVEVPTRGPVEEDWVSSSSGPKFGQCNQTLLRCPEILENGMYQRRKQKSIAEIIKGEVDAQSRKDEDVAQKGTNSGEQPSSSRRKKMKGNDMANGDDGSISSFIPRKREGTELSGSRTARKGKRFSVETDGMVAKEEMDKVNSSRGRKRKSKRATNNDDSGGKEGTCNHPVSAKRKVKVGSGIGNSDAENEGLIESVSLLRERKKSKYLSPPYTSPTWKLRKMDIEEESLKVSDDTQVGEQMTKATGNPIRSPLVPNYISERNQHPGEVHAEHKASNESTVHTPKQYLKRMIDLEKVKTPANEVLIEVHSVALSPQYRRKNNSIEIVMEFLSVFRSSVYRDGSNYKIYNQFQSHRKRKTSDSVTGSSGKDQNPTDYVSSGHGSQQKMVIKNKETKMDQSKPRQATRASLKKTSEESNAFNPKIKQGTRAAVMKKNDQEVFENASSTALFVTFGPGSSLPSKDELIRIYSRYGALDTEDTDMFYDNFCARVVFLRSSDAEQAFNSSQSACPFGASNVSFRLRPHSATSAHERREIPNAKPSPTAKEGAKRSKKPLASQSSAVQTSQLNYIRHKLEMLTSMLEISDEKMSSEIKSKLQSEIKGLLETVNTMFESSS